MAPKSGSASEPQIARDASYYRAPDALRTRIRASIAARASEQSRPTMWRWGGMAASFAVAALLTWNGVLLQARVGDDDRLVTAVATAHVRSLMLESHLNDVVSTDQHTVKPWFEGKLDFAPQVADLAPSGFTLMGGRLDYVNGRAVAALIYRHRLHVVNLFEWPAAGAGDSAPASITRSGYALVHWRRGGIQYWAISDVAGADLLSFARLLTSM